MATKVLMPKLGLTMTEGTIEEWKFKEGDAVKAGDILFSVATDKLTNDIEADTDGVLLKILLPEGETAPCKSVIAYIGAAGEVVDNDTTAVHAEPASTATSAASPCCEKTAAPVARAAGEYVLASPYAKKLAKEKNYDLSLISGTGPKGVVLARDVESYIAGPKTSPMAAKLAAEYGVDVSSIDVKGRMTCWLPPVQVQ